MLTIKSADNMSYNPPIVKEIRFQIWLCERRPYNRPPKSNYCIIYIHSVCLSVRTQQLMEVQTNWTNMADRMLNDCCFGIYPVFELNLYSNMMNWEFKLFY